MQTTPTVGKTYPFKCTAVNVSSTTLLCTLFEYIINTDAVPNSFGVNVIEARPESAVSAQLGPTVLAVAQLNLTMNQK